MHRTYMFTSSLTDFLNFISCDWIFTADSVYWILERDTYTKKWEYNFSQKRWYSHFESDGFTISRKSSLKFIVQDIYETLKIASNKT